MTRNASISSNENVSHALRSHASTETLKKIGQMGGNATDLDEILSQESRESLLSRDTVQGAEQHLNVAININEMTRTAH